MSPRPSNAVESFSDTEKSGIATGRAGAIVLAGMAAGFLMLAGCQTVADTERVHIRQEMDYATVDITDRDDSISRMRLRGEGIGCVGTRGEFYDHLPTDEELRPIYGF